MSNIDEQLEPGESYAAAPRLFRGEEIKPYSDGNKMLLAMITQPGDPDSFFLFSLLYVLTNPRSDVQRITRNKDSAREAVLEWMDDLKLEPGQGEKFLRNDKGEPDMDKINPAYVSSGQEKAEAMAVEILQEANKGKVDPIASAASGNALAPAM